MIKGLVGKFMILYNYYSWLVSVFIASLITFEGSRGRMC
jgi:hypothetical protein